MKEPVIVTDYIYKRGSRVFESYKDKYNWIMVKPDEGETARAVETHGAKIAVLGGEVYKDKLYGALRKTANGGSALIARFGVGYDGVDRALCRDNAIYLTTTPGTLDQSVAEHAISAMFCLSKNLLELDGKIRKKRFEGKPGIELQGKTIGIMGFGNIGKKAACIASKGLGMRVAVFDAILVEKQAQHENRSVEDFLNAYGIASYTTNFDDFAPQADFISMHMPLLPATHHYLNAERIGKLKPGSYIINTGRGPLIDEDALYTALSNGHLAGAALDVFEAEPYVPVTPEKDLTKLSNVVLTPHTASDTNEANDRMAETVIHNIGCFLADQPDAMNLVELQKK